MIQNSKEESIRLYENFNLLFEENGDLKKRVKRLETQCKELKSQVEQKEANIRSFYATLEIDKEYDVREFKKKQDYTTKVQDVIRLQEDKIKAELKK